MRIFCIICADYYDGRSSTIATLCGHNFHEKCISKWIRHSKTCPECREPVTEKNIIKLFLNVSDNDGSCPEHLENEVSSLKAKLTEKDAELRLQKTVVNDFREMLVCAQAQGDTDRASALKYQSDATSFRLQVHNLKCQVKYLAEENDRLKNNLQIHKNVQTLLAGTQKEAEEILKDCADSPQSSTNLATYCLLLKKEVQSMADSKLLLRRENAALRRKDSLNAINLNNAMEKSYNLDTQVKILEAENVKLLEKQNKFSLISNADICYESPTPERLKRPEPESTNGGILTTPVSYRVNVAPLKKMKIENALYEKSSVRMIKPTFCDLPNPKVKAISAMQLQMQDQGSVVRNGYNGFGGHSRFISRSSSFVRSKLPNKKKKSV